MFVITALLDGNNHTTECTTPAGPTRRVPYVSRRAMFEPLIAESLVARNDRHRRQRPRQTVAASDGADRACTGTSAPSGERAQSPREPIAWDEMA